MFTAQHIYAACMIFGWMADVTAVGWAAVFTFMAVRRKPDPAQPLVIQQNERLIMVFLAFTDWMVFISLTAALIAVMQYHHRGC
jgi:hypothetical protein